MEVNQINSEEEFKEWYSKEYPQITNNLASSEDSLRELKIIWNNRHLSDIELAKKIRESSKAEHFLKSKNLRKQASNEIIIDTDDTTENGVLCYMQTGLNLINAGYHIELWFADGMKNPHIHIKNIVGLEDLSKDEGTRYRKLFYEKYIPQEFWNEKIPDFSICNPYEEAYHPIAEENKPHHKYKTLKTLRSEFNKGEINQIELGLLDEAKQLPELPFHAIRSNKNFNGNTETLAGRIAQKISIISIADSFGLKPLGKKFRVCPFHADSNPSLSLNDELGLFNCFGCHVSGNIILFYALLKKLNPNFKIEVKQ